MGVLAWHFLLRKKKFFTYTFFPIILETKMNEIFQLTGIYHEVQEGALCAQHALNNLLQRELFSAVSLADIAR